MSLAGWVPKRGKVGWGGSGLEMTDFHMAFRPGGKSWFRRKPDLGMQNNPPNADPRILRGFAQLYYRGKDRWKGVDGQFVGASY